MERILIVPIGAVDRNILRTVAQAVHEAVHELGHTYGLGHCPDPTCVMHFSNALGDTDLKGPEFCNTCRRRPGPGN